MEPENLEMTPEELVKHARKHPHTHTLSTEAFSVSKRDFVIHNVSMKGDPINDFDIVNYRRGLAFLEEIVNFKEVELRVAKKGLRKFYDIMPEFLDIKNSHISNSKHYGSIKSKMFDPLKTNVEFYNIYITEKANGENAQVSWDEQGQFWVIGSKNKTLLLSEIKDLKYLVNKHEHNRTILIAEQWFSYLESNADKIEQIKQKLSHYTLIGEICDSEKSGHIVDYGVEAKLYFFALVHKEEQQFSCEPPSHFLHFSEEVGLNKMSVKFTDIKIQTFEALIEELKIQMYKINEGSLEEFGEGVVIYITTTTKGHEEGEFEEHCVTVCKLKTLEYRIYRKLREKMKQFFEKYKKGYEKNLMRFIEEFKELKGVFNLPKPDEYYENIGRRAFEFCENQEKHLSKFFHNKFIGFLKLLQNEKIDKETFKKIAYEDIGNAEINKLYKEENSELAKQSSSIPNKEKDEQGNTSNEQSVHSELKLNKKVIIFVPLTIPASGKSTIFKKLKEFSKEFEIRILSSDTVRAEKMAEMMQKQKNMNKKTAYEKSRESANKLYYKYLGDILKEMEASKEQDRFILFMDKNHPENALKVTLEEIKRAAQKCKELSVKIVCVLPECEKLLSDKPKYMYPFSSCYVVSCLKRVLNRELHETLEGTEIERSNVCVNFANMFRNYSISNYNLSKYFDSAVFLPFTNEEVVPEALTDLLVKILMGSKPNSFNEHPELEKLILEVKNWKNVEIKTDEKLGEIEKLFLGLFSKFEELKVDVEKNEIKME